MTWLCTACEAIKIINVRVTVEEAFVNHIAVESVSISQDRREYQ